MKPEELEKILELQSVFVKSSGEKGMLANLRGANLEGANLRGADLRRTTGNGREIKSIQAFCYPIAYTSTHMFIGCEGHTISDWERFTPEEIHKMDGNEATVFLG